MKSQAHILNGDALKDRFPSEIPGKVYVMRECMVDGPVKPTADQDLFTLRSDFLHSSYQIDPSEYLSQTVHEINRISAIGASTDINLWFEEDLFCQVNFWYTISVLQANQHKNTLFFVPPKSDFPYSFANMHPFDLISAYHHRIPIRDEEQEALGTLWTAYQNRDLDQMHNIAGIYHLKFPFLTSAVEAFEASLPTADSPGRPTEVILDIIRKYETTDFGTVFKHFCREVPIYGYGDLQVRKLLDEITTHMVPS